MLNAADKKTLIDIVTHVVDAMETDIRHEVRDSIDAAIAQHRQAVWSNEIWCCVDMRVFAKEVWGLPNPPGKTANEFGQTKLMLRKHYVNYCPFCGAKA